jgi:hypothetical protein
MKRSILAIAVLMTGCTAADDERGAESDRAHEILVSALDAWQQGAATELAKQDPPIRFVDDDLVAGYQLTGYAIDEPEAAIEPFDNVLVNLNLRDRQGKTCEKTVAYQVSLSPGLAVLRSEP